MLQFRCIMNTVRFNITLPLEIAEMLKNVKNKSSFIAEAIRERVEREEKANLIKELSEGYKVRKKEDKELSLDWDTTSGDGID
jgi:metal-responsive CopG/Arc/MetJ family transcriptional regulator